jgi:hypothetical protein
LAGRNCDAKESDAQSDGRTLHRTNPRFHAPDANRPDVQKRRAPAEPEVREADPPVSYVVGTPKGRLNRLEQQLIARPWHEARPGVQVKLLPQDGELYVFAESADRVAKERAMRRRQLKWLWARLKQLSARSPVWAAHYAGLPARRSIREHHIRSPRLGGESTSL